MTEASHPPEQAASRRIDIVAALDVTDRALDALRREAQDDATRALQREIVAQRDDLLRQLYGGPLRTPAG